jgi:hypothetical protein
VTASDYIFSAIFIALIFRQIRGRRLTTKGMLIPVAVILWILGTGSRGRKRPSIDTPTDSPARQGTTATTPNAAPRSAAEPRQARVVKAWAR